MTRENTDRFEYDVALSFAEEERVFAKELAHMLGAENTNVLLDEYQAVELGGSDFVTHIAEIFRTKARYCVMLISQHYPLKKWTAAERTFTQAHALRDADEYIIPIQLDDVEVAGIREAPGYRDFREHTLESIVILLKEKLAATRDRSGPPSQSHDLRSGNVPPAEDKTP
jgi:hypothetical protein